MKEDERWMGLALSEACRGVGLTAPNPPVGAVVVKDGRELARGWHQGAGQLHAEREALAVLRQGEARGATIYITLEPCSTVGRTSACTDALIEAGIAEVVYGTRDPNPAHAGRADEILTAAGVKVRHGILEKRCRNLIRGFAKVQTSGLPWIIAKTAMSLDGRITRPDGEGPWLTSAEGREEVQLIRAECEAIITSGQTVRRDNPALTLRSEAVSPDKIQPLRVVLTRRGLERTDYQLFTDGFPTRLFEKVPLIEVLKSLVDEHDCQTVLLESGGRLMGEFLDQGLIDEAIIFLAPLVCGGIDVAIGGNGVPTLKERWGLLDPVMKQLGPDLMTRGHLIRHQSPPDRGG